MLEGPSLEGASEALRAAEAVSTLAEEVSGAVVEGDRGAEEAEPLSSEVAEASAVGFRPRRLGLASGAGSC